MTWPLAFAVVGCAFAVVAVVGIIVAAVFMWKLINES